MPGLEVTQRQMEQAILETEKFKVTVEVPPGKCSSQYLPYDNVQDQLREQGSSSVQSGMGHSNIDPSRQKIGTVLTDDDFFHITCHIDSSLRTKIENGEFVDLDKLLPKDNGFQGRVAQSNNETKLEWVQQN